MHAVPCVINPVSFASGVLDQTNNNTKKNNGLKRKGIYFFHNGWFGSSVLWGHQGPRLSVQLNWAFLLIIQYGRVYVSNGMIEEGIKKKVLERGPNFATQNFWQTSVTQPHLFIQEAKRLPLDSQAPNSNMKFALLSSAGNLGHSSICFWVPWNGMFKNMFSKEATDWMIEEWGSSFNQNTNENFFVLWSKRN